MSGFAGATYPLPVTIESVPSPQEGAKAVCMQFYWGVNAAPLSFTINLLSQYQSGQFTTVQSVFVDNRTVPFDVLLTALDTGQRVFVRAFAYGWYHVLVSRHPEFTLQLLYNQRPGATPLLACTTNVQFMNVVARSFNTEQVFPTSLLDSVATQSGETGEWTVLNSTAANGIMLTQGVSPFHYLIFGFNLTISTTAGYPAANGVVVSLNENAPVFGDSVMWEDYFVANTTANAVQYTTSKSFAQPLMQVNTASAITFKLSSFPSTGNAIAYWQISYGTVLIQ